ncbi:MAG: protein phosphatase 2C domain-containing protein [Clostridia bacterium]|nr:protein phosphatase 2C domain-containing protein [Clostridia bacterium]
MKHFSFSRAGRAWNEDRCYSCEDYAFVLDGATSLFNQKFSNLNSDAEWYSEWWCNFLTTALSDYSKSVPEILQDGVGKVVEEFKKLAGDCEVTDFPSACISIARRKDGMVEIYTLGDSPIILQSKNDMSIVVADTLNNVNDDIHKMIIKDIAVKNNMSIIEAKTKFPDCIKHGRNMKNSFGGHYILADSKDAILHGVYKKVDESLLNKIILVTDGYSQIFDLFEKYTINEVANKIDSLEDVENLYQELYNLQENDPEGNNFIRFKMRDDATLSALLLQD